MRRSLPTVLFSCLALFAIPLPAPALDPVELRDLVDGIVRKRMEKGRIPGAVISVVWNGEVVLSQGYGYADRASRKPVSAEKTLFRVGSVAKPVTATAVLQLVERGKLRLDADIAPYLEGFRSRPRFSRPVTVADLLTHTAGLDTTLLSVAAPRPSEVLPLGRYLADRLPPFVRPPGRFFGYSNHGYTLLGYLVERASGRPFARYLDEEVFRPLGMRRSSFLPVPPHAADLAVGYELRGGEHEPAVPVYPHIAPAAGLATTGADMARFLIAHLEGGAAGGRRVLGAETVREMQRTRFTEDPRMPGMACGFFETFEKGSRGLFHGGGIRGFTSGVYLWPEQRLGVFVSNNGSDDGLVRAVSRGLLDRFFPASDAAPPPAPRPSRDQPSLSGVYRALSHPRTTFEKSGALRGSQELRVRDLGNGTLSVWGLRFVEVAPQLYQEEEGTERIAFRRDPQGRGTHLFTEEMFLGNEAWERLPEYATASTHQQALLFFALVFAVALFLRPREPHAGLAEALPEEAPDLRRAVTLGALVSGLNLLFLVLMVFAFRRAAAGAGLLYGLPPLMAVGLAVPLLSIPLSLALPVFAARLWRRGHGPLPWRLFYTLLTFAALGFGAFLAFWNLLGYRI